MSNYTLINIGGVPCHLYNHPGSGLIYFAIRYNAGAQLETNDEKGIFHLFEHLVFNSSSSLTHDEFTEKMDSLGAEINAYTDYDDVVFQCSVPKENFLDALETYFKVLGSFAPTEETLEKEKGVVLQELQMREDHHWIQVYELFRKKFLINHPARQPIIGFAETINAVTVEAITELYNKYFIPANINLVVTGAVENLDSDEGFVQCVTSFFKEGERTQMDISDAQRETVGHEARGFKAGMTQHHLMVAHPYDMVQNRAEAALAGNLLGGSMYSYLFKEFREKRNLSYVVGADTMTIDPVLSFLVMQATVEKDEQIEEAMNIFREAINWLQNIEESDFERVRTMTRASILRDFERTEDTANRILTNIALGVNGDPGYFTTLLEEVTFENFQKFAASLSTDNFLYVVYSPDKAISGEDE